MKHVNYNIFIKLVTFTMVILVMAAGCSRSPLTTDNQTASEPQLLHRSASSGSVFLSTATLSASSDISAEKGGTLTLLDVTIEIPPKAISSDTVISLDIPDFNVFLSEFGTAGLVFDEPITIIMSYRDADLSGIDESTIRIASFNEETGEFESIVSEVNYTNQTVTGQARSSAAYGLITD